MFDSFDTSLNATCVTILRVATTLALSEKHKSYSDKQKIVIWGSIMLKTLQLKDLDLGRLDAKNELLGDSIEKRNTYLESFVMPRNIDVEDYYSGDKAFIKGLKGTGKTALMRYMSLIFEGKGHSTEFVLFKSDFSDEDKKEFSKASNSSVGAIKNVNDYSNDYELVWKWFIHRQIVKLIDNKDAKIFEENDALRKYINCVNATNSQDEEKGLMRIFPKLKRGNIELEGGHQFLKGKLGLDFEWEDVHDNKVPFSTFLKKVEFLYDKLVPTKERLFLFFDELELNVGKEKDYQRDILLIRDLIITINKFNIKSISKGYGVKIITGIRSEVLYSTQSSGKEINKIVSDFGSSIVWYFKEKDELIHPLLSIIERKIRISEKKNGIDNNEGDIWGRYFPDKINSKDVKVFLLEQSWYRPRDIVRLLTTAKNQFLNETMFIQRSFDETKKEYSQESWSELVEELRANYDTEKIDAIKKLFYGIENPFSFNYISNKFTEKKKFYKNVELLYENHKIADILTDLYRVGIVGNTGEKVGFSFRGDNDLLLENDMTLHTALRPHLALVKKKYKW